MLEATPLPARPRRVAVVGAGYFAPFQLDGWQRLAGVELVALCDLDAGRRQALGDRFQLRKLYEDCSAMLAAERPDVLDIITPPPTHAALCALAFERGIDVICQKPLAPTLAEAEQLVAAAHSAGCRLIVHENWRFQPWYREVYRLIAAGQLGDRIHRLSFRLRTGDGWPADAYLARQPYFRSMPRLLIYETGIHFIDTFRYLAGEVVRVYARLQRLHPELVGEDAGLVVFDFANGATGLLDANRYNEPNTDDPRYTFGTLLLEGSAGSLRLYEDGRLTLQPLGEAESAVDYQPPRRNFAGDCVFAAQQHFLQALVTGQPAETEGQAYLRNLYIQEAIYRSAHTGQSVEL